MKFFAKAICDRAQIENRKSWDADGIELYLRGTPLWDESTRDLLNFASDNFKQVNLEIGDRISQEPLIPADLLGLFTVNYIRAALETLRKLPNGGKLIVHLAAHCEPIIEPPYLDFLNQAETRGGTLQLALEQVERLDPKRERILLENIIVLDWMDEETGKMPRPRSAMSLKTLGRGPGSLIWLTTELPLTSSPGPSLTPTRTEPLITLRRSSDGFHSISDQLKSNLPK